MAELAKDPKGWELEDFVAAHFVSRGRYVETGVKERTPDEILELDLVWTDYRKEPQERHPVEVKSGEWGVGDVFKFYGWTRYLGLEPGQFIHKEPNGRLDPASLTHIEDRTRITMLHVPKPEDERAPVRIQRKIPVGAHPGVSQIEVGDTVGVRGISEDRHMRQSERDRDGPQCGEQEPPARAPVAPFPGTPQPYK